MGFFVLPPNIGSATSLNHLANADCFSVGIVIDHCCQARLVYNPHMATGQVVFSFRGPKLYSECRNCPILEGMKSDISSINTYNGRLFVLLSIVARCEQRGTEAGLHTGGREIPVIYMSIDVRGDLENSGGEGYTLIGSQQEKKVDCPHFYKPGPTPELMAGG